uniref:Uncharacterized protein LOC105049880 n=1 Tax=Elaeis guineensis var. tenera TaxID=51953 RepID=A0A6I9RKL5_ELAGV|nr:uncharacterized protein LOC105049880 [Elaeis guineensis]
MEGSPIFRDKRMIHQIFREKSSRNKKARGARISQGVTHSNTTLCSDRTNYRVLMGCNALILIINHGIDAMLTEAMLYEADNFLDLPLMEELAHTSDGIMGPTLCGTWQHTLGGFHGQNWCHCLCHSGYPLHMSRVHLGPNKPCSRRKRQ